MLSYSHWLVSKVPFLMPLTVPCVITSFTDKEVPFILRLFWNVPTLLSCPNWAGFALMMPLSLKPSQAKGPILPSQPFKAHVHLRFRGGVEHLLKTL